MTCSRLEPAIPQPVPSKTVFHLKKNSSILCANHHTNISPLKREVHSCNTVFKNVVPTSWKTYYVFIAEANRLMQFREIMTVNYTTPISLNTSMDKTQILGILEHVVRVDSHMI